MAYLHKISFWYLTLFLLSGVGRDIQTAIAFSRSTDYAIFEAAKMDGAFVVCLSITLVLDLAASYFVLRPRAVGFWVILAALGFAAIYNVVVFDLAFRDLKATEAAYMASRALRGVPANPDTVHKVFSPEGMRATLGVTAFLALSSLGALALNRWRFFPQERS